jgi:DNA-binding transcriptional MerR regulator
MDRGSDHSYNWPVATTTPAPPAPPGASTRLRVEALAAATDTSVDTIRFYQKRRLLPPPEREGRIAWYGPEHVERLARIRDLQARGLSLALIGRIVRGELDHADAPLAAAVAVAIGAGADPSDPAAEALLTLDELAARAGVPVEVLRAVVDEGLLAGRRGRGVSDGEPRFVPSDVEVVTAGMALLAQGLPLPALLALARAHHDATRDVAMAAVELFDEHVRRPLRDAPLSDDERAQRLVDAFTALLPAVTTLVGHHFRQVLLQVAQEHLERVEQRDEQRDAR